MYDDTQQLNHKQRHSSNFFFSFHLSFNMQKTTWILHPSPPGSILYWEYRKSSLAWVTERYHKAQTDSTSVSWLAWLINPSQLPYFFRSIFLRVGLWCMGGFFFTMWGYIVQLSLKQWLMDPRRLPAMVSYLALWWIITIRAFLNWNECAVFFTGISAVHLTSVLNVAETSSDGTEAGREGERAEDSK